MATDMARDMAGFVVRHKGSLDSHPNSILDKLSSQELVLSSRDQHVRAVLHGAAAGASFHGGCHLLQGLADIALSANNRSNDNRYQADCHASAASEHFAMSFGLGLGALICHSLTKVLPHRRRNQLKPKEQALLRKVDAVRDAHRKGSGVILPPRDALRVTEPGPPLSFVCESPSDGSRWRAIRIA